VQLPFIAASLAGILFMYRFALAWTTATAALAVTALLATLQYAVLYGQLARPYAIGLFSVALLADQWTRWLAWANAPNTWWVRPWLRPLCAYTPPLRPPSWAALIMGSGLALAPPHRPPPLAAGPAAPACCSTCPTCPSCCCDSSASAVCRNGWPRRTATGSPITCGGWRMARRCSQRCCCSGQPPRSLAGGAARHGPGRSCPCCSCGSSFPAALGYGYSVWRAPVLQHSVLVFSFPFALVLLFGGLDLHRKALAHRARRPPGRHGHAHALHGAAASPHRAHLQVRSLPPGRHGWAPHTPDRLVVIDAPPEVLDLLEQEPRYTAAPGHYLRLRDLGSNAALLHRIRAQRPADVVLGLFHSTDRAPAGPGPSTATRPCSNASTWWKAR
jgi:hypothetical protein